MIFPSKPLKTWKNPIYPSFCLSSWSKTYKIKNSVIENIILGSKLRRWNRLFCMRIKLLLLSNTIFKPSGLAVHWVAVIITIVISFSLRSKCGHFFSYLFLSLLIWWWKEPTRTSTSIKGQALFRNFIKPTMSFGASFHMLYHSIMAFICWKTFWYFKLIHIGVKIQSQIWSMVLVDSSIVHIILTWLGNADILYLLPGILPKLTFHCVTFFSWN